MNYLELEAIDFKQHLANDPDHLLIDVREEYEFEDDNIGGINIPMGDVLARVNDLRDSQSVYICCKSGKRSKAIAFHLSKHISPCKVYSLKGGIESYRQLQ